MDDMNKQFGVGDKIEIVEFGFVGIIKEYIPGYYIVTIDEPIWGDGVKLWEGKKNIIIDNTKKYKRKEIRLISRNTQKNVL